MSDLQKAIQKHVNVPEAPTEAVLQTAPVTPLPRKVGWMKTRIIGFGLKLLGQKLDGKKTVIGGIGLILLGVSGLVGVMYPDQGLPQMDLENSWTYIVAGFSVLGLGGKAEKLKSALTAGKEGA